MDMYTIGHSTHEQGEFIGILKTYHIEILVDVRSYPRSNYVPQFNKENMEKWIPGNGIEYIHMKELGGRRKAIEDIDEDLVSGWEKKAFRNYAEYSLTDEYERGINKLIALGEKNASATCVPKVCPGGAIG